MLIVHEVHSVDGRREDDFDALWRDEWIPALGAGDDSRVLHYLRHTHGTGVSYRVVTLTAFADGAALVAIDLAAVPTAGVDHRAAVFMEDTVWPDHGLLDTYIDKAGSHYARWMDSDEHDETEMLRIEAAYRTAWGSGRRNEIVLWQRVTRLDWIPGLLVMEVPEHLKAPGTWMHDALQLRDQWESRLLRSTRWSPLA